MPGPAFQRVEDLFHQAVALAPEQRSPFLEAACGSDSALRLAVEELLRHDQPEKTTAGFLVSPVAEAAERLRSESPTLADAGGSRTTTAELPLPSIAGYEMLKELGRGGMGVVYLARQMSLDRCVAVKMLLPGIATAPHLLSRFRTEVEVLARLHHPNIVPIYDFGEHQGQPYFTMEYIAGPSLADCLAGRPQEARASARLLEVLARTIHAVHQAGLIHRDLKPANVLFQEPGSAVAAEDKASLSVASVSSCTPRISDFGLAKDQAAERKLTPSGAALGTPCYMAPEQARSRESLVGPAADLYALGAILYEMLTGRPPFEADTVAETLVQLLHDEPLSPLRLRPGLPYDLVTICLKCLEKTPRRRYASAWELAEDLRRFQAGEPIRARPVSLVERGYRWCCRRPLVAALLAVTVFLTVALLVTVLLYDAWLQEALAKTETRAENEQRQIVQLHIAHGVAALEQEESFTALLAFTEALRLDQGSPEHNHRVRIGTTWRQCPALLRVRTLETLLPRPPLHAALRGDGRFLAVVGADGTGQLTDLSTGQSRSLTLGAGTPLRCLAFDPDGRLLLTEYAHGSIRLGELSAQAFIPRQQFSTPEGSLAALSDNGSWLVTLDGEHRAVVWEVALGQRRGVPVALGHLPHLVALSPDGRRLAVVSPDNVLTFWEVATARSLGPPIPLPRDVSLIVFSPDGERVVTAGSQDTAQVWQVATGELRAAWSRLGSPIVQARFSPDGHLLLLAGSGGEVRVWDVETGQAATPSLGTGERVAWATFHDGGNQVVTLGTVGSVRFWRLPSGPEIRDATLEDEAAAARETAVDRGGRVLTLANGRTVTLSRTSAGPLSLGAEQAPVSPDGRSVVVCLDASTVRVWDTATGAPLTPPLRHPGAVLYAAFSPEGLLLTASDDRTARLWDARTGEVLAPPLRHTRAIQRVFFAAEDRACVLQEGHLVATWDLTPDPRPGEERFGAARELTGGQH